jgi:uncharacterized BrkB/YihY/UPF0761 family membrane protein
MGNQYLVRSGRYLSRRSVWLLLLSLLPGLAHASFNGAPCHTFECHFQTVGIFLGLIGGLPISGVIFIGVHMGFAHPQRSKVRQMFLGGLMGLIAFEIAAVVGAAYAMEQPGGAALPGFLGTYALLAVLSFLYVRTAPRSASQKS